jgi:hypothetical protein
LFTPIITRRILHNGTGLKWWTGLRRKMCN